MDNALFRIRMACLLAETTIAARDLDQLRYPADTADERIIPLLEIDSRPSGQTCCLILHLVNMACKRFDSRKRLCLCPQHQDHVHYALDRTLIEDMNPDALHDQPARNLRLRFGDIPAPAPVRGQRSCQSSRW